MVEILWECGWEGARRKLCVEVMMMIRGRNNSQKMWKIQQTNIYM